MPSLSRAAIAQLVRRLCGAGLLARVEHETPWERSRHALTPAGFRLVDALAPLGGTETLGRTPFPATGARWRKGKGVRLPRVEAARKVLRQRGAAALLRRLPSEVLTIAEMRRARGKAALDLSRNLIVLSRLGVLKRSRFRSGRPREYRLTELGREMQAFFLEIEQLARSPVEAVPTYILVMQNAG